MCRPCSGEGAIVILSEYAPPEEIPGRIDGNAVKPGPEGRSAAESLQFSHDLHAHLLGNILGVLPGAAPPVGKPVYHLIMPTYEILPGLGVATPGPVYQIEISAVIHAICHLYR